MFARFILLNQIFNVALNLCHVNKMVKPGHCFNVTIIPMQLPVFFRFVLERRSQQSPPPSSPLLYGQVKTSHSELLVLKCDQVSLAFKD